MKSRYAIMIDAGYFFAQGANLLYGEALPRGEIEIDKDKLLECLKSTCSAISQNDLLRVYWYDGAAFQSANAEQRAIAESNKFKLRLGNVNSQGEQKGVDALLICDMWELARNKAVDDIFIMSGDEDFKLAISNTQAYGIEVHLLSLGPAKGAVSPLLIQEADTQTEISKTDISTFFNHKVVETEVDDATREALQKVASLVSDEFKSSDLESVISEEDFRLDPQMDGKLLGKARDAIGRRLEHAEKVHLRKAFIQECISQGKLYKADLHV